MLRRSALVACSFAVLLLASFLPVTRYEHASAETASGVPNILVIMTDDQSGGAHNVDQLSRMPNVQRWLVQAGTLFPNAYVTTPLCCPSRSSLMSGRYAHNHGVTTHGGDRTGPIGVPGGQPDPNGLLHRYLRDAGYFTAIAGKFLVNLKWSTNPPNWDRWAIMGGGYYDPSMNLNGVVKKYYGAYSTTLLGEQAAQFLRSFDAMDDGKPWFLEYTPQAPHADFTAEKKYATAAVGTWSPTPAVGETDRMDKPPWVRSRSYSYATAGKTLRAKQIRTLYSVDNEVGRIFTELQALGELENTIVFYLSDNGFLWGEHGIGKTKRFPYTESVGIPFIVRWPGEIAPAARDERIVLQIDIMPTLFEMLKTRSLDLTGNVIYPMDGETFYPLETTPHRSSALLEYFRSPDDSSVPTWASILTPTSQYVEWYDDAGLTTFVEYYDLVADPWQLTNVVADADVANDLSPERLAALRDELAAYRTCAGASCP